jgi:hypothetical protein
MTEETPSGEETATAEIPELPEKCIRQHVLTAVLKRKCLSNLTQKDQFTAGNVFLTIGHPEKTEDTKFFEQLIYINVYFIFLF